MLSEASDPLGVRFELLDVLDILLDVVRVDPGGANGLRVEQPDKHGKLEHVVEGDEVEDETSKLVNHVEEAEDDPVGKPLLVIILALLGLRLLVVVLEGMEGHEDWISDTEKCGDKSLSDAKDHEKDEGSEGVLH